MSIATIRQLFNRLNHDYTAVHQAKEALFWTTHMALGDDHERFASAEIAYKDFISCPQRLEAVSAALAELAMLPDGEEKRALEHGLRGWQALFECNVIGNQAAREALHRLIEMESALFAERRGYVMAHINERGEQEEASLGALTTNMANNRDEAARKSSHNARLGLEQWVLAHGFVDIVKQRNRLARAQGFRNFFDYTVQKNDRTSTDQLFALLDDFEARTRGIHLRALGDLAARLGADALRPWNLPFHISGDVGRRMAPYLPYAKAVERWVKSFGREHGYLIDNPAVGPSLVEHCWQAGSIISLDDALSRLTSEAFNARYLADACSRSVEEAWAEAQRRITAAGTRGGSGHEPAGLDARIRLVHGEALIADNSDGDEAMFRRFESWVAEHYPASAQPA